MKVHQDLRDHPGREVWRAASSPGIQSFRVLFTGFAGKHHQKKEDLGEPSLPKPLQDENFLKFEGASR
jgi:hypothetical protein